VQASGLSRVRLSRQILRSFVHPITLALRPAVRTAS
jgi:hypothetical protein